MIWALWYFSIGCAFSFSVFSIVRSARSYSSAVPPHEVSDVLIPLVLWPLCVVVTIHDIVTEGL